MMKSAKKGPPGQLSISLPKIILKKVWTFALDGSISQMPAIINALSTVKIVKAIPLYYLPACINRTLY